MKSRKNKKNRKQFTMKKETQTEAKSSTLTASKNVEVSDKTIKTVPSKSNTYTSNAYTPKSYNTKTLPDLPEVELVEKIDYELYFTLLGFRSHSYSQTQNEFVDYLEDFCQKLGATTTRDSYGSLYVTKGQADLYPCAVAHTDINQAVVENVRIYKNSKWIFGFNMDEGKQCGLGADDKNGVYFCLAMLKKFDNFKCAFFLNEEVGCIGSGKADFQFFSDCSMILQLDRRSYTTDLITFTNGIETCSKEFVTAAGDIMTKYGYSDNRGVCTDVGAIKKSPIVDCIACNVSCGYINEHSANEVVSIKHFENAVNFGAELLSSLGHSKWKHVYQAPVYVPKKTEAFARQGTIDFEEDNHYGEYYTSRYSPRTSKDRYAGTSRLFEDSKKPFSSPLTEEDLSHFPKEDQEALRALYDIKSPIEQAEEEYYVTDQLDDASLYGDTQDEIDQWYLEYYPQFNEEEGRKKLKHYVTKDSFVTKFDITKMTQTQIDDEIVNCTCPNCLGIVEADNVLLLNSYCTDCGSIFNIPPDEYHYLMSKRGEGTLFD